MDVIQEEAIEIYNSKLDAFSSTMEDRPLIPLVTDMLSTSTAPAQPITRKVLSRDAWEALKPVIQRLYIEEGKTFRRISIILRDQYGFTPTKAQFDKRVAHWGFKKNASQSERRAILQGERYNVGEGGKMVNQGTRERWEKEFERGQLDQQNQLQLAGKRFSVYLVCLVDEMCCK
jgi:hypothetical protein